MPVEAGSGSDQIRVPMIDTEVFIGTPQRSAESRLGDLLTPPRVGGLKTNLAPNSCQSHLRFSPCSISAELRLLGTDLTLAPSFSSPSLPSFTLFPLRRTTPVGLSWSSRRSSSHGRGCDDSWKCSRGGSRGSGRRANYYVANLGIHLQF
jgi:hypothetical protein